MNVERCMVMNICQLRCLEEVVEVDERNENVSLGYTTTLVKAGRQNECMSIVEIFETKDRWIRASDVILECVSISQKSMRK